MHSIVAQSKADFRLMWYPEFIDCFSIISSVVKEKNSKATTAISSLCVSMIAGLSAAIAF